ncbi:MAG: hypothetical protein DRI57_32040 [Deltaproteobacteria bacterium]|nr:MAG: hypothetical protein DRI57_32040 [Deltaproteobacteria bacterium]
MIRCQIALLAKNIVRDSETNSISVFHIIENFKSVSFPVFIPEISFFAHLIRGEDDPDVIESLLDIAINELEIISIPAKADFQGKFANRLTVRVEGLAIPKPGILTVNLRHGDTILAHYDVSVESVGKPRAEVRSDEAMEEMLGEEKNR